MKIYTYSVVFVVAVTLHHGEVDVWILNWATLTIFRHARAYLIFVLFSPRTKFLVQFFSTPKRVNRDKTDFATKQRKSHKREIMQQNSIKCDTFSSPFSCGKNFHLTGFPHMSPHDQFFLHTRRLWCL